MASRFPSPGLASDEGLLCVGGKLTPEWLLDAYRHGIFPWPMSYRMEEIPWWSPDPRAIFELDRFHVSRRLARTIRSGRFTVTFDKDFRGVIEACATAGDRDHATWITPKLQRAYERMAELGHAHSVEVWREGEVDGELVGGVYGVAIGGLFAGESMFHREADASKVALAHLVERLRKRDFQLFDIQQLTPHTVSLGAIEIPRDEYLRRLAAVVDLPVTF